MKTERFEIKNRHGLKLVIQVDTPEDPKNLVIIAHGQGGFKEQVHIQAFTEAFLENDYRVVRFDATHALGESEGELIDVTYTSYIEDLEDVINWARSQDWFQQPFALCGHSMGAQSTAWYAEHHPDEVLCLTPMVPPVNFELYKNTVSQDYLDEWKSRGYVQSISKSKLGHIKRVGWGVNESLKKYDLLPFANRLTMPVLVVVGEQDEPCPPKNERIFMDAIASNNKKLIVIPGAEHSYRNARTGEYGSEIEDVKQALNSWLHETVRS